jgi:hypothetical protein
MKSKYVRAHLLVIALLAIISNNCLAQAPQLINYQAVVRGSNGQPVAGGTPVSLLFTIHDGSATGPLVFTETDNDTTNQFGLVKSLFLPA